MMEGDRSSRLLLLIVLGAVAVGVPLGTITQPFIDPWSWRQSDVAAISRNFTAPDSHFAYPRIDWAGDAPGYVGTEFPILPFVAAGGYKIFGVHEWVGRLQALLFFAISIPFLVALVRHAIGESAAAGALCLYAFAPVTLMSSRCFMPDMPSLSLSIVGLYLFARWLTTDGWLVFIGSAIAMCFAFLIKLPTAVIGAPLACLAIQRFGWTAIRRAKLWLYGAIILLPSIVWYWHAARIAEQFYPHHFFGAGGFHLMPLDWYVGIIRRTVSSTVTAVPLVLAAVGCWTARKTRGALLFYVWLAVLLLFVIVVGYGNRHPWYQLPLVPVIAAFGGQGIAWLAARWQSRPFLKYGIAAVLASIFFVQSYGATSRFLRPAAADLRILGLELKQRTAPGSLIVVADYGDPTALYYAERKGWHFTEKNAIYNGHPISDAEAIADLKNLRSQGATHIAFYSGSAWWLDYYVEFAKYLGRTSAPVATAPAYQIFELR